jgi:hypothetical protein
MRRRDFVAFVGSAAAAAWPLAARAQQRTILPQVGILDPGIPQHFEAFRNSLEAIDGVRQHLQESFRLTRHSHFPHDLARIIHDADARLLDRHIQSSKIGHAALLLLMLEAADADLVSPSA